MPPPFSSPWIPAPSTSTGCHAAVAEQSNVGGTKCSPTGTSAGRGIVGTIHYVRKKIKNGDVNNEEEDYETEEDDYFTKEDDYYSEKDSYYSEDDDYFSGDDDDEKSRIVLRGPGCSGDESFDKCCIFGNEVELKYHQRSQLCSIVDELPMPEMKHYVCTLMKSTVITGEGKMDNAWFHYK
ncbi:hypothetical protein ACQ4PT_044388 [Festuca glaucescens]